MTWAIIKTGGKQYRAEKGKILRVEKLSGKEGDKVTFSEVLLLVDSKKTDIGTPQISGAAVEGKIVGQEVKGPKLVVFKMKPKKRYRVKKGHRQKYTEVEITKVGISKQ